MMFGMVGAGTLARAIATHPLRAGHEVIFSNSRGPETLGELVDNLGPNAHAGTVAQAGEADIVVLAVNWVDVPAALRTLPPRAGRLLVDATNQWSAPPPASVIDTSITAGSEFVASLLPDAHVIKAFDNLYGPRIAADPYTSAGRRILFYAGDDGASKSRFRTAVEEFGYAPVDLGSLRMGRLMQIDGPISGLHAIREDPASS